MNRQDRQASTPLFWLSVVTALSLVLHVLRAGLFAWVTHEYAEDRIPRLPGVFPPGLDVGLILEIAVIASSAVCGVAGLVWLHAASTRAHALGARMKHSPWNGVGWFLIPLINLFMPLSVAYDLWRGSGGDAGKSRMVLFWFGAYALGLMMSWMWVFGGAPNLLGQAIIAASSLTSLALARRITRLQATVVEVAAEFGPADEDEGALGDTLSPNALPEPEVLEPAPRTVRVVEPRATAAPGVIYAPRKPS